MPRIRDMLANETPEVSHGIRPTPALGRRLVLRDFPKAKRKATVEDQQGTESNWLTEMRRVRDHQDKMAFAALFNHFAPRIKGFLIKSGADATMAEETEAESEPMVLEKINVSIQPAYHGIPVYLGVQLGLYEAIGLDVNISVVSTLPTVVRL